MHHLACTCPSHCLSKQVSITTSSQETTNQPTIKLNIDKDDPRRICRRSKRTSSCALNLVDSSFVNRAESILRSLSFEVNEQDRKEKAKDSTKKHKHQHNTNNPTKAKEDVSRWNKLVFDMDGPVCLSQ